MFHKILCATDFSEGSHRALAYAARLATEHDAELVVAHAWYVPPLAFGGEYVFAPRDLAAMLDDARRLLDDAAEEAKQLGAVHVTARLLEGLPDVTLADTLHDPAFDLVVIGTHGRTGLARVLLGSVAEKIVRHAPCSVLAVHLADEPRPARHVLCPTDFSESSEYALELAAGLVRPGGAGITLLHVLELPIAYSGEPDPELQRSLDVRAAELLDARAAKLAKLVDVPVTKRSRIGAAGAQALAVLDHDRSYDLVIVGSHGRTGIRRALLGSVAEKIVRHAHCPVLVARRRTP